ncbi:hypothetical protein [Gloeothece verrucosa]|uniref:hypothetical protein n=1 Tax=Gloeothece verrucosa TaxID=2546359 RepID=UPI001FE08084|nr:hypothetical protein [Gloeothece verrucosa]
MVGSKVFNHLFLQFTFFITDMRHQAVVFIGFTTWLADYIARDRWCWERRQVLSLRFGRFVVLLIGGLFSSRELSWWLYKITLQPPT